MKDEAPANILPLWMWAIFAVFYVLAVFGGTCFLLIAYGLLS